LAGHPRHIELIAMFFHPGVLHRDSFAKYAAAFFTISKSSFALDSSRRNRTFSASNSAIVRFTGTALPVTAFNLPDRLSCSQFHKLEYGTPNRFAASVHPIDSVKRTASTLNSAVYRRFPTDSFLFISPSVHQEVISNLMYVKPGQGQVTLASGS
jgi:hypothetical protein